MMPAREIDELFAQMLTGDHDDDEPGKAVHTLRRMGTREIFEKAAEWCRSDNPLARARGADVLGQLGKTAEHPSNIFPEESYAVISALVQREPIFGLSRQPSMRWVIFIILLVFR
jgi:hypothetical protein